MQQVHATGVEGPTEIYAAPLASGPPLATSPPSAAAPAAAAPAAAAPAAAPPIIVINNVVGGRSVRVFREKCSMGFLPGSSVFRIPYPKSLSTSLMTEQKFNERMSYINSTAAKAHGCLLSFTGVFLIFIGMILVFATGFANSSSQCPSFNYDCSNKVNARNMRAFFTMFGLFIAAAVILGVSRAMLGYKAALNRALSVLNEIDARTGFEWNYDIEVWTTTKHYSNGTSSSSSRTYYYLTLNKSSITSTTTTVRPQQ